MVDAVVVADHHGRRRLRERAEQLVHPGAGSHLDRLAIWATTWSWSGSQRAVSFGRRQIATSRSISPAGPLANTLTRRTLITTSPGYAQNFWIGA
jgi:hypothetical protein